MKSRPFGLREMASRKGGGTPAATGQRPIEIHVVTGIFEDS